MKKYITPQPGPTPKPGDKKPSDEILYKLPFERSPKPKPKPKPNPKPKRKDVKEVYSPKERRTYLVDKKSGKSVAMSVQGPKFRPRLTKGGR